jgi:hypothetical protein
VPVLLLPAAAALVGAIVTPPPLSMKVTAIRSTNGVTGVLALAGTVKQLRVSVDNVTGTALTPHFATSTGANISDYWKVLSGPKSLAPHASAVYLLAAPHGGVGGPGVRGKFLLRAVTPQPMSMTTSLVGVGPALTAKALKEFAAQTP